jgi:ABC-2 type transport system permease protein
MIRDTFTVAWKEWREFRDQLFKLRRGGLSAVIVIGMLGVFMPLQMGELWLRSPLMLGYWPLLASGMVSTLIADAFAGERERHTLESLLATRLSDTAILVGKVAAAVLYGLVFTFANIVTGYVVLTIKAAGGSFVSLPIKQLLLIAVLVVLACAALAGIGVFISLRAATVRQAQQTLGIIMMVLLIAPFLFLQLLDPGDRIAMATRLSSIGIDKIVGWAILILAIAAVALNGMALVRFKRGKLVLD